MCNIWKLPQNLATARNPWILRLLGVSFDTLFYECSNVHSKTVFVQKVQNFFGGFLDIS